MIYLRKELFLAKTYNKLKMKKIELCRIVRKFSTNAYEIELQEGIGISTIFNIPDLYPYKETETKLQEETTKDEIQILNWKEQMPKTVKKEVEVVLEKRVSKRTRGQVYFHYLLKWKGQLMEDASWITTTELQKYGVNPESLMKDPFLPRESDAGASRLSQQWIVSSHVVANIR